MQQSFPAVVLYRSNGVRGHLSGGGDVFVGVASVVVAWSRKQLQRDLFAVLVIHWIGAATTCGYGPPIPSEQGEALT